MNFKAFLLVATVGCVLIWQASANCVFSVDSFTNEYRCTIENSISRDPNDFVDLSGAHIGGRDDADVMHVTTGTTSTFEDIPTIIFLTFTNLRTLTVSPHLMRLSLKYCGTNFRELWLSGNGLLFELKAGAFRGCPSLETLVLMHSSIQSIDDSVFDDTPNLAVVIMENNFLPMVRSAWLWGLRNINFFNLFGNQITSIQPGTFVGSGAHEIWLDNNRLTRIESGTFIDMPNLASLRIMGNLIATIEAGAFGNLPQLDSLRLSGNQITTLHANIFATPLPIQNEIRFEFNRINAVARNFFDGIPRGRFIHFGSNVCIDNGLNVETSMEVDVFPYMQTCFNNYDLENN